MSYITVIGTFHLAPGQEEAGRAAFEGLAAKTVEEPGCIEYVLHGDPSDAQVIATVERWTDEDALAGHMQMPYVAELVAAAGDMLDQPLSIVTLVPLGG